MLYSRRGNQNDNNNNNNNNQPFYFANLKHLQEQHKL